eukprot:CAMPEP_0184680280 /NCGR_PEP_ID=MMETSP0312-20130426/3148_1 /TAXON_ID=31354 /ORGANISM="Compsopogon coeruleus, Strain SAG 36.94" /LENGTH=225 /DNA_ID=CAMNT_0027130269 /DNA_START=75 /DNA_END=752 /DNA_ORIENTATION=-
MKFRDGKISLHEALVSEEIYANYGKRERASSEQLRTAFETENVQNCLEKILRQGEVQLSVAERKAKVDKKRAEIITFFNKYYVDPRSKVPIPATRFENGLTQIKARIDPDIPAERQAQDLYSKLSVIIPMRKMTVDGILQVPHRHMGAVGGIVSQYLQVSREQYTADGCVMEVQAVPGEYDRVLQELARVTQGDFNFEVVGVQPGMASDVTAPLKKESKSKKGKK